MTEDEFCRLLSSCLIKEGVSPDEADKNANWAFDQATFDGQRGWGLDFLPSWGYNEATNIAKRWVRQRKAEAEEY